MCFHAHCKHVKCQIREKCLELKVLTSNEAGKQCWIMVKSGSVTVRVKHTELLWITMDSGPSDHAG